MVTRKLKPRKSIILKIMKSKRKVLSRSLHYCGTFSGDDYKYDRNTEANWVLKQGRARLSDTGESNLI